MKKSIVFFITLAFGIQLFSVVPFYYGARSLSLGYSSSAFNYDINAIFINPALLSALNVPITGYQFQNGFFGYRGFYDDLNEVLKYDLKNFEGLDPESQDIIHEKLKSVYGYKHGMYGFNSNLPGVAFKRYGFSVSFVNTSIINPLETDILDKFSQNLTNNDIKNLEFNIIGLKYTQYSLAYGLDFSQSFSIGVAIHYLNGKVSEYNRSITSDIFSTGSREKEYIEYGWAGAEKKFGKVVTDFSLSAVVGKFFRLGIIMKNFSDPKIQTELGEIVLNQRIIAAIAFKPDNKTGIFLDIDIKKGDLLHNGNDMQPISIGLEKSFFNNKFFLRAGFMSDLTEQYFIGKKGNVLYAFGMGFNMGNFMVDAGLGLGNDGKVRNLAISGFFIMK
ncbi:MAG: hypothetical protein ABFR75_01595 [Acidobacteriota bacterium]